MGGELVKPVHINVSSFLKERFWWSHYGVQPNCFDTLDVQGDGIDYGIHLITKGYIIRSLRGEGSGYADGSWLEGTIEQLGRTAKDLMGEERILFSRYTQPKPLVWNEISIPWYPEGVKERIPSTPDFTAFHPADYETYEVIDQVVRRFAREYCNVSFSEVSMGQRPSEEEVRQVYEAREREAKKHRGKIRKVVLDPDSLALIVGRDEVARFPDIEQGVFAEDDRLYAELKDGSRHPIGKPRLELVERRGLSDRDYLRLMLREDGMFEREPVHGTKVYARAVT